LCAFRDGSSAAGPLMTTALTYIPGGPSRPAAFWLGVLLITVGVLLHAADFLQMRAMEAPTYAMSATMAAGMAIDLLGLLLAAWGLLPRGRLTIPDATGGPVASATADVSGPAGGGALAALDSARMTAAHWRLMVRLFIGLTLDTMKPATIGFMLPGLKAEYGLLPTEAALLPLFALTGTTLGSIVFGRLADLLGRRASFILTALILAATSICGLMPGFPYQLGMCFLMGLAAGGELPVIYALLAETMPARHRGWLSVVVGGLGGLSGYLAASAVALFLEPTLSWRVLWLPNLPTALFMLLLLRWVPESPRFLLATGHHEEARKVMARVGVLSGQQPLAGRPADERGFREVLRGRLLGTTVTLCLYGFAWGLCSWGMITWLPTMLRGLGQDAASANRLLATSALFAIPGTLVAALLYALWSSKKTAVLFALATTGVLALFGLAQPVIGDRGDLVSLLVIGLLITSSSMIGVLAPYSVELYPTALRGAGSGVVAASTKLGGLIGPGAVGALLTFTTGLAGPALVTAVPIGIAALLMAWRGVETRGRPLEDLSQAASPALRRTGSGSV
jgi:putative MFS transporter